MMKQMEDSNISQLEGFLELSPVAAGIFDQGSKRTLSLNTLFQESLGYHLEDVCDLECWASKLFVEPAFHHDMLLPWLAKIEQNPASHDKSAYLNAAIRKQDGHIRQVHLFFTLSDGKWLFYLRDITEHWVVEQRLNVRSNMLEMVAKSSTLREVLTVIVQQVQGESPPAKCSVLLFNQQKQQLILGAAPDLPSFYNQAIHGVYIGENIGSCGAAAFHGKRIIVEDIDTHPNWQPFTDLTQAAGLHSCWSEPIFSSEGELLGTFAIYNSPSPTPLQKDIEQIQFASNLASIAIENYNAHQELEHRAHYDYLTGLANRRSFFELSTNTLEMNKNCAMLMMDVDHFKKINDIYGHDLGDLVLKKLAKKSLENLPEEAIIGRIGGEEFAILLPDINITNALKAADSLREVLSKEAFIIHDNETIHFTVSLGVTFCLSKHSYVDELLREADTALYKAKQTGRNRVCMFNSN